MTVIGQSLWCLVVLLAHGGWRSRLGIGRSGLESRFKKRSRGRFGEQRGLGKRWCKGSCGNGGRGDDRMLMQSPMSRGSELQWQKLGLGIAGVQNLETWSPKSLARNGLPLSSAVSISHNRGAGKWSRKPTDGRHERQWSKGAPSGRSPPL